MAIVRTVFNMIQSRILLVSTALLLSALTLVGVSSAEDAHQIPAPTITAPVPPPPMAQSTPSVPSVVLPPPVAVTMTKPLDLLVWDSTLKEQTPAPGAATADFVFKVTNSSDSDVVIT